MSLFRARTFLVDLVAKERDGGRDTRTVITKEKNFTYIHWDDSLKEKGKVCNRDSNGREERYRSVWATGLRSGLSVVFFLRLNVATHYIPAPPTFAPASIIHTCHSLATGSKSEGETIVGGTIYQLENLKGSDGRLRE